MSPGAFSHFEGFEYSQGCEVLMKQVGKSAQEIQSFLLKSDILLLWYSESSRVRVPLALGPCFLA